MKYVSDDEHNRAHSSSCWGPLENYADKKTECDNCYDVKYEEYPDKEKIAVLEYCLATDYFNAQENRHECIGDNRYKKWTG